MKLTISRSSKELMEFEGGFELAYTGCPEADIQNVMFSLRKKVKGKMYGIQEKYQILTNEGVDVRQFYRTHKVHFGLKAEDLMGQVRAMAGEQA
jgi:hypothetical protein